MEHLFGSSHWSLVSAKSQSLVLTEGAVTTVLAKASSLLSEKWNSGQAQQSTCGYWPASFEPVWKEHYWPRRGLFCWSVQPLSSLFSLLESWTSCWNDLGGSGVQVPSLDWDQPLTSNHPRSLYSYKASNFTGTETANGAWYHIVWRSFIQQIYPGSVHELPQKKFQLGIRGKKNDDEQPVQTNSGASDQRGWGVSFLGDIQNATKHSPKLWWKFSQLQARIGSGGLQRSHPT